MLKADPLVLWGRPRIWARERGGQGRCAGAASLAALHSPLTRHVMEGRLLPCFLEWKWSTAGGKGGLRKNLPPGPQTSKCSCVVAQGDFPSLLIYLAAELGRNSGSWAVQVSLMISVVKSFALQRFMLRVMCSSACCHCDKIFETGNSTEGRFIWLVAAYVPSVLALGLSWDRTL